MDENPHTEFYSLIFNKKYNLSELVHNCRIFSVQVDARDIMKIKGNFSRFSVWFGGYFQTCVKVDDRSYTCIALFHFYRNKYILKTTTLKYSVSIPVCTR